jgi:hypothetical protein
MHPDRKRIFLGGVLAAAVGLAAFSGATALATETHPPVIPHPVGSPNPTGTEGPEKWIPIPCPSNPPWSGAAETRALEGLKPKIEFASIRLPQPTQATEVYCDWWQKVPANS